MNLPISWLNEFVDVTDIDIKNYCDRMTDTGSKVEGWSVQGGDIENVCVGKILSVERHPDADRLVICSVDVGEEKPRQIVTAATNVYAGAYVPVAKAPAKVAGGVSIKSGKLRGAASDGMFCSVAELGLTLHDMSYAIEDGILILNDDPTLGEYKPVMILKRFCKLRTMWWNLRLHQTGRTAFLLSEWHVKPPLHLKEQQNIILLFFALKIKMTVFRNICL